jgi:superfamily II DNA or RNA helicase
MECIFGPEIFHISYQEAVALGLTVPIFVDWLPVRLAKNPVKGYSQDIAKKRWGIWRNLERNYKVAQRAGAFDDDTQVLVLLQSIEHAVHLHQFLPQFEMCYGSMKAVDLQGFRNHDLLSADYKPVDAAKRENMRAAFEAGTLKKVIATDIWATGVDFPELQELVRADERDSPILGGQGPARVSRTHDVSGKRYGRVTDFADFWDDRFKAKARRRFNIYKKYGWEQSWPSGKRQISA